MRTLAAIVLLGASAAAQIGMWETRAPYPLEATEVAAAAIGAKVYVVGGLIRAGSTNRLFIYDPFTDTWLEGAPLPILGGVDHPNVAAVSGKVYFLGGIRIGTGFVTGRTFEYDPADNTWTERAPMPIPRAASGVAALGGRIYVAGGLADSGSVSSFEAFDPTTNSWTVLPPMPTARDHLTAQAVGSKFYAIAGRRGGSNFNVNEEYDPVTNTWTARASIPTPRGGLGSGTIGGRIQVFGGEGPSGTPEGTFPQNEEYDPSTDTWRILAPMPTPRHGIYGATVDGRRLFVPSGGPRAGGFFSSVHEAFYPPPASRPATTASGVVNAASFGQAVAPGSLVSLFGTNLAPAAQVAVRQPLPTQMNATSVLVNGKAAPMLFAGPGQINFQVPSETTSPATIVVRQAGVESELQSLSLLDTAAGLFSVFQNGRGQGAILIGATGEVAAPSGSIPGRASRPANRGEFISIFCTGLGAVTNSPATGAVAVTSPLSETTALPSVTIGGVTATVSFSGLAPGFVGLYQVNVQVAENAPTGDAVELVLTIGGVTSNTVTIAVQ